MKNKTLLWLVLCSFVLSFTACEETEEAGEFDNWRTRNQLFIDSIATVAEENADGNWLILKSYMLPADDESDLIAQKNPDNYVYCHIEERGDGDVCPIYTDSTLTNYRVWFMNGRLLDQSFKGSFDPDRAVPFKSSVSGMIVGWTTALQYMRTGDVWTVYMPYTLGYGKSSSGSVPPYSALKYWINLVGVYPTGTPVPGWQ